MSDFVLLPHHRQELEESMISPEVIEARGYRSITDPQELLAMGYSPEQAALVPGWYAPSYNLNYDPVGHNYKPDHPRTNPKTGKIIKYERPPGSKNILEISPYTPKDWWEDIGKGVIATEGLKKLDSLMSDGWLAVALNGTQGWRYTDPSGSKRNIPDFREIPLRSRKFYLGFDNDAMTKPEVYQALVELGEYLKRMFDPVVQYLDIKLEGYDDQKLGIDDFRRFGGDVLDLIKAAKDEPKEPDNLRKYNDREEFWAFPEANKFLHLPTSTFWVPEGVNATVEKVVRPGGLKVKPTEWLMQTRSIHQTTWAPGRPQIIEDHLFNAGSWEIVPGKNTYNAYRPPSIELGDPELATRWVEHIAALYPDDVEHILNWFAHRVQHPGEKINHALVLGGAQGIGKDTLIDPLEYAVGEGNFGKATPGQVTGRFNSYFQSVVLLVNEMRDMGEGSKFSFYEHMKMYTASPPYSIAIEEKYRPKLYIPNVVGIIYTTNNERDSLYLVPEDRRHYIAWSEAQEGHFTEDYFMGLHRWYDKGGRSHVAALLTQRDLSGFNPKAPPIKTPGFWQIIDAHRNPEEDEVRDLIDALGWPDALIIPDLVVVANVDRTSYEQKTGHDLAEFLTSTKTRKQIPHKLAAAGYISYRNPDATDGRWLVGKKKHTIFVKRELSRNDRRKAAELRQSRGEIIA